MIRPPIQGFGDRLRAFRKQRGLSQDALATLIEAEPNVLSRYERGVGLPSARMLAAIAIALDVSVSRLLLDGEHADSVAAAAAIADPALLDSFRRVDQLMPRDRQLVIGVVDALVAGIDARGEMCEHADLRSLRRHMPRREADRTDESERTSASTG